MTLSLAVDRYRRLHGCESIRAIAARCRRFDVAPRQGVWFRGPALVGLQLQIEQYLAVYCTGYDQSEAPHNRLSGTIGGSKDPNTIMNKL